MGVRAMRTPAYTPHTPIGVGYRAFNGVSSLHHAFVYSRDVTKRVLVVDDSATMRRMVIAALRPLGEITFDQAVSGLDAIERVMMASVDLVLLDLNMPDMHGLEVLRFIRGQPTLSHVPVVILTTRGDQDSRAAALRGGATMYLTKPFVPASIVSELRPLLEGR
jgi:two-component system chemotaxis response regulator CheY